MNQYDEQRHTNPEKRLAADVFSSRRRELVDNPGAIRSASTVHLQDIYGNLETWNVETFRTDGTVEAFVQRNGADGAIRIVLPPKVMAALDRQRGSIVTASRKRGAQQAMATRLERGDKLGNPDALKKARRARKAGR